MKRLKIIVLMFIITLITLCILSSCNFTQASKETSINEFKVVGYYSGDLFNEPVEKLQTDKLTHIMYSFVIPKVDGSLHDLKNPEQLIELVNKAHKDGSEVFISLGGWSYEGKALEPVFKELAASNEKRKLFIENVCAMVEEYNLDGVGIPLYAKPSWKQYRHLVAENPGKAMIPLRRTL